MGRELMAVDDFLNDRFRTACCSTWSEGSAFSEKRMMGGVCFLVNGNMLGGANRQKDGTGRFMFRVGKDLEAEALARPGAIPMINGEKRMGGMVFVDEAACDAHQLQEWVVLAFSFVGTLPPKKK